MGGKERKGREAGEGGQEGRKGKVYISGSFWVSNTAAKGIPKFDTGPQKSNVALPRPHQIFWLAKHPPMKYYNKNINK